MKVLQPIVLLLLSILMFQSCDSDKKGNKSTADVYQCPMHCEGDKTYAETGSCPICKMELKQMQTISETALTSEISEASIFNLTSSWHTEEGLKIQLKDLKGKTLVFVMIYSTCKAACPRLVADMRNIETI